MTNEVVDSLKNRSRPLTKKMMLDVATISSNNDESVGKIIADVYNKVGKTGMVTVEKSQGSETTFETTTGHQGRPRLCYDCVYSSTTTRRTSVFTTTALCWYLMLR